MGDESGNATDFGIFIVPLVMSTDFIALSRSLPSAIDDAHDTLYEPNAVFRQFLGSPSMTFFHFSFRCFHFLSCLFLLFLSFLLFPLLFRFRFLVCSFHYLILFSLFLFSN